VLAATSSRSIELDLVIVSNSLLSHDVELAIDAVHANELEEAWRARCAGVRVRAQDMRPGVDARLVAEAMWLAEDAKPVEEVASDEELEKTGAHPLVRVIGYAVRPSKDARLAEDEVASDHDERGARALVRVMGHAVWPAEDVELVEGVKLAEVASEDELEKTGTRPLIRFKEHVVRPCLDARLAEDVKPDEAASDEKEAGAAACVRVSV
jgi:hypothetical protein